MRGLRYFILALAWSAAACGGGDAGPSTASVALTFTDPSGPVDPGMSFASEQGEFLRSADGRERNGLAYGHRGDKVQAVRFYVYCSKWNAEIGPEDIMADIEVAGRGGERTTFRAVSGEVRQSDDAAIALEFTDVVFRDDSGSSFTASGRATWSEPAQE